LTPISIPSDTISPPQQLPPFRCIPFLYLFRSNLHDLFWISCFLNLLPWRFSVFWLSAQFASIPAPFFLLVSARRNPVCLFVPRRECVCAWFLSFVFLFRVGVLNTSHAVGHRPGRAHKQEIKSNKINDTLPSYSSFIFAFFSRFFFSLSSQKQKQTCCSILSCFSPVIPSSLFN